MDKNDFASKIEYEPLESPPEQQQPPQLQQPQQHLTLQHEPVYLTGKDYHAHWLCCCGDCDAPGWAACCLAYWCPWIAVGWNLTRVSGNPRLGWLVGLALLTLMLLQAVQLYEYRLCYVDYCSSGDADACQLAKFECVSGTRFSLFVTTIGILIMVIGIGSRRYIRKKLGLDSLHHGEVDTLCCDFWSWQCHHCGLCQETRTLMINRVEDGVWRGPATAQVVYMSMPMREPQPVQMMV